MGHICEQLLQAAKDCPTSSYQGTSSQALFISCVQKENTSKEVKKKNTQRVDIPLLLSNNFYAARRVSQVLLQQGQILKHSCLVLNSKAAAMHLPVALQTPLERTLHLYPVGFLRHLSVFCATGSSSPNHKHLAENFPFLCLSYQG